MQPMKEKRRSQPIVKRPAGLLNGAHNSPIRARKKRRGTPGSRVSERFFGVAVLG
jgi:hypothetical protein